jgi:hypothetical protein
MRRAVGQAWHLEDGTGAFGDVFAFDLEALHSIDEYLAQSHWHGRDTHIVSGHTTSFDAWRSYSVVSPKIETTGGGGGDHPLGRETMNPINSGTSGAKHIFIWIKVCNTSYV